jgi:hypothetical protein
MGITAEELFVAFLPRSVNTGIACSYFFGSRNQAPALEDEKEDIKYEVRVADMF